MYISFITELESTGDDGIVQHTHPKCISQRGKKAQCNMKFTYIMYTVLYYCSVYCYQQ